MALIYMARLFPHSSLHWSPHFSHTHSLKCPLNYASFSPGAYFPASCLIIPLCPLGSCSNITPSGKIFTLDWIGHPASKLSSQYHNTDNDHFWSLLPSEDQRLLECRHSQVWHIPISPVPNTAAGSWEFSSICWVKDKLWDEWVPVSCEEGFPGNKLW